MLGWVGLVDVRLALNNVDGSFSRDDQFHPTGECSARPARKCTLAQMIPNSPVRNRRENEQGAE